MKIYRLGQRVRLSVTFRVDGVLTDPTTVTLKVMDPEGNIDTYVYGVSTVQKESLGVYYADIIPDEEGEWNYRYEGTGTCTAVEEDSFLMKTVFS